jgi:N-acetyl-gamma-glutamyl-phosphate reductase
MNVGIVGVTGFGGSELLRLVLGHPHFKLAYVGGESSAGQRLDARYPALAGHAAGALLVETFAPEKLAHLELLFASLPTGKSREPLARVPPQVRVVDVGGDHRFVDGWAYGLTELPGARDAIRGATRVANPGCFPAAALLPLAPLLRHGLIEPTGIVIDAKSGVTGTGRGGASDFGYVETSEDVFAYGLAGHPHVPEMEAALARVAGGEARVAFTPHIVPMKRGILATCYARPHGAVTQEALYAAARTDYASEPFMRIVEPERGRSAHTAWASGSNLAFLSYAVNERTGLIVATGAIDNLGKGAAAQAVQNANLMLGTKETAGLDGQPLWP